MYKVVLALAASASAFQLNTPPAATAPVRAVSEKLESMEGSSAPMGVWDPLGLSFWGSDKTLKWYRAAEIKHGRVAMAATVGWIINELGICFPGDVATGVSFKSLGTGVRAWEALPDAGKLQIILFLGAIEINIETQTPHYTLGDVKLGSIEPFDWNFFDPAMFTKGMSEEAKARGRLSELNNGRLAMIAAAGMISASYIPGSVPLLPPTW
ncbi:hypothetical protein CTAYLR_001052 [Chrysophaeum taylorii]|uniref:Uncharacterized protein n=1 Tax=Chrysophaeum taylorii TaxID=2483200 RepID=A0AAD7XMX2_9STRA|nr:hypothetical protein CTAYLR_001052 [Chrysophaeum taylorii]